MKTVQKIVKTGRPAKEVGVVDVPIYDTIDELIENETEEKILACFNQQNCIRIMGNERAKHTPGRVGKSVRMNVAFSVLTIEELTSVAGDPIALKTLLLSAEIQARVDAKLAEEGQDTAA